MNEISKGGLSQDVDRLLATTLSTTRAAHPLNRFPVVPITDASPPVSTRRAGQTHTTEAKAGEPRITLAHVRMQGEKAGGGCCELIDQAIMNGRGCKVLYSISSRETFNGSLQRTARSTYCCVDTILAVCTYSLQSGDATRMSITGEEEHDRSHTVHWKETRT